MSRVCFCTSSHPLSSAQGHCFSFFPSSSVTFLYWIYISNRHNNIFSYLLNIQKQKIFWFTLHHLFCPPCFFVCFLFLKIIVYTSYYQVFVSHALLNPLPVRPLSVPFPLKQLLRLSVTTMLPRAVSCTDSAHLDLCTTFDTAICSRIFETLPSLFSRFTNTASYLLPQCWLLVVLRCLSSHRPLNVGEPWGQSLFLFVCLFVCFLNFPVYTYSTGNLSELYGFKYHLNASTAEI